MTDQQKIAKLLLKKVLATLTPDESTLLDSWRNASVSNQQFYDKYANRQSLLQEYVRRNRRNERISMRLTDYVARHPASATRRSLRRLYPWGWAAAVLLIVSTVGVYWWLESPQGLTPMEISTQTDVQPGKTGAVLITDNGQEVSLDTLTDGLIALQDGLTAQVVDGALVYEGEPAYRAFHTIRTPKGRQFQVSLADGTQVWLNAGSSLRYPLRFDDGQREVFVTGEAYFDVAPNAQIPFLVNVNDKTEVMVLGTEFNIAAYANEDAIYTTLIEGKVRVASTILWPGQQAKVSPSASPTEQDVTVINGVDMGKITAWKNGVFDFEGDQLPEVMKQLERWYDIEVVYDGKIPTIEFGGKMSRDLTLKEVLLALEKSEVHFRLQGRTLTVFP